MAKKTTTKSTSKKGPSAKEVATLTHDDAKRKNIPTAEYQPVLPKDMQSPIRIAYERRNRDLDPQLVWRGKDDQDWSDLIVHAPPLFIQEKIHPKVLIDDLVRRTAAQRKAEDNQFDLFADFNGLPDTDAKTEFYQHDAHWSNRMILGDSLQVMASLAEREGLRGQVQCIYIDPPYGIRFNSNFQWSTTSRDVKDGNKDHITREPEQVRAFRDTWRDGIHSYLTYLRDRLTVARDLLADSGSIFVQIGDENVHLVRAVMDEVFGEDNFSSMIFVRKSGGFGSQKLDNVGDFILWYARDATKAKYRKLLDNKAEAKSGLSNYGFLRTPDLTERLTLKEERLDPSLLPPGARLFGSHALTSARPPGDGDLRQYEFEGRMFKAGQNTFKTDLRGLNVLAKAGRLKASDSRLGYVRFFDDYEAIEMNNNWDDTRGDMGMTYIVQTSTKVIERCLLMTTDPGDLVLDPTCGSGTTATVAEQWGRRWITIDTSRVALALARARIMGARYPSYLLADSKEGVEKEAEVSRTSVPDGYENRRYPGSIRQGFVYERVPHIMLKNIASNAEIDVIWEKFEAKLAPVRAKLTKALPAKWVAKYREDQEYTAPVPDDIQEWEIPREKPAEWPAACQPIMDEFWRLRIERQREIDASIAAKAEYEYLYDKPYEDKKKVRVAGPFTVESISPHRTLGVGADDELLDPLEAAAEGAARQDFAQMVMEHLKTAGVHQAHKEDRITFTSVAPWPGKYIAAEGRYSEGDTGKEKRAAILIGPEFGTVSRQDLVTAAREAGDADFDVVIACAFNYEAHASEFNQLGRVPVLKARMNAELHMGGDLKNTGKGNLFVIFGEPDIDILMAKDGTCRVRINGVDVFHPQTGEVRSDGAEGIACWFIDTDYNDESFFVRHAYFLGANDPYKSLRTTLKAEVNEEAWSTLHSDTSRPFPKPTTGKIAVKVINHLGDEVMKVYRVE